MENLSEKEIQKEAVKVYSSAWEKIMDNNNYRMLAGALIGSALGTLYWNFVGCTSGSCALTSNPYKTIILFTFIGVMMARKNKNSK